MSTPIIDINTYDDLLKIVQKCNTNFRSLANVSGTEYIRQAMPSIGAVTGVKGASEPDYRTGDVEIDEDDIGIEFLTNAEISTMFANA